MIRKHVSCVPALGAAALLVAACESGDVNLQPTNVDNSVDNSMTSTSTGDSSNPCASYQDGDETRQGSFDGTNCTYGPSFVSFSNPLTTDLEIPLITGVHIFQDTLAVGENVSSGAAPAGGTGPTLTISAGATLAFLDSSDYLLVNRGASIMADGSPTAPITLTGYTDAVSETAGAEDVQLWGGVVINGNGITNNCSDQQRTDGDCHVESEGQPSYYGGNDNTESSGVLRYVVVKHTGYEVAPGDELNGISFNAVGSGTTVSHIQTYSTFDDGIEFFGGAVNVDHFIGLYVRDDSIDFSDGYVGTIDTALVIHAQTDGNRCVEGDNIGSGRATEGVALDTTPQTNPTIANMTCILSNSDAGTHDPSEGIVLRRGPQAQFVDSIVFGGYADDVDENNECFEIDDGVTRDFAQNGDTTMTNSLIACEDPTKDSLGNADDISEWVLGANPSTNGANYSFNSGNAIIDDPMNANVSVLDSFYTATSLTDASGNSIGLEGIGAVTRSDDWTLNWSYGLHSSNQGQALWFVQ